MARGSFRGGGGGGRGGGGSWGGSWTSYRTSQNAKMAVASACPLSNSGGGTADSKYGFSTATEKYIDQMKPWEKCWFFFRMLEQQKASELPYDPKYYEKWLAGCNVDRMVEVSKGIGKGTSQNAKMAVAGACPLSNSGGGSADSKYGFSHATEKYIDQMKPREKCWFFFKMLEQHKASELPYDPKYYEKWLAGCNVDRMAEVAKEYLGRPWKR